MMAGKRKDLSKIRVKMSKIRFPEICPVCLEEPEDLVFVTILEKFGDDFGASSWNKQEDKVSVALNAAKGAITFTIPTCMLHGSRSVRTLKTKLIAALGFFILFYPILFYILEINVALVYSRPLTQPILGLTTTTVAFLIILLYGLYPRALERAVHFDSVNRANDQVLISIKNKEYRSRFLELNKMVADVMNNEDAEPHD
jgi:hypothetical protein